MEQQNYAIAFHDVFKPGPERLRTLYGSWACGTFDKSINYAVSGDLRDAIVQTKLLVFAEIFLKDEPVKESK